MLKTLNSSREVAATDPMISFLPDFAITLVRSQNFVIPGRVIWMLSDERFWRETFVEWNENEDDREKDRFCWVNSEVSKIPFVHNQKVWLRVFNASTFEC